MELEKCKGSLAEAAKALARAEKERAEVFQTVAPAPAPPPVAGIDLSPLLGADEKEISESMFTVNLGPEFDNSDGLMDENDLKEVERRKQL
eukprot:375323-Pyramimonas_sp.AAC.1